MAKSEKGSSESHNIFDRILKANAKKILLHFLASDREWDTSSFKELPTELSKTKERRLDYLAFLKQRDGTAVLLHLEFQVQNHKKMLARMQEYHAMLYEKYGEQVDRIEQMVVYLGSARMRMRTILPEAARFKGFGVVSLRDLDPDALLSVQIPEVLVLAILATKSKEPPEELLRFIIDKLRRAAKHPDVLKKYLDELLILGRLRFGRHNLLEKMEAMGLDVDFKPEDDYYYQLAERKWKAKLEEVKRQAEEEANRRAEEVKRQAEEEANRRAEEVKRQAEEANRKVALVLLEQGVAKDRVAELLDLSLKELDELLKDKT